MSWSRFLKKNYDRIMQLGIDLKDINVIKVGNGELFKHQLVKFLICYHLLALKHHFKTEQPICKGICDVIDLDTFTIYEIESNLSPFLRRKKLEDFYHPLIEDIFIVDLKKMRHWRSIFALRDEVEKYCGLR
jgi:hypothetical protein